MTSSHGFVVQSVTEFFDSVQLAQVAQSVWQLSQEPVVSGLILSLATYLFVSLNHIKIGNYRPLKSSTPEHKLATTDLFNTGNLKLATTDYLGVGNMRSIQSRQPQITLKLERKPN